MLDHLFYDRETGMPLCDVNLLEKYNGRDQVCAFVAQLPVIPHASLSTKDEMDSWLRHIGNRIPHLHPERFMEDSDEIRQSRKHTQSVLTLSLPPEMITGATDRIHIEALE